MSLSPDLPALLGGVAVRPEGPPDWPPADEAIRLALQRAWADGSWGRYHAGHVEALEARLAQGAGVPFALTCGSGTFAVELALRALKIGPGDEVVLAGYDYPGNFLAVHAVGARPVLVDVGPEDWNLDVTRAVAALGPKVRAVIASHLHGGIVRMRALVEAAAERGVRVVEDAAQAPGAVVEGRLAGTWGDVGTLSFGGSKLLTAGRGGAVLTRHADVAQRARVALSRGNLVCPLSELQAAVLRPQLDCLAQRNTQRALAVARLAELLGGVPGLQLFRSSVPDSSPVYYKVGLQFDAIAFGLSRERFVMAMRAEGVALDEGFRALHVGRSPGRWQGAGPLLEAERAGAGALVLHHPVLLGEDSDVEQVTKAVRKVHQYRALLAGPRT